MTHLAYAQTGCDSSPGQGPLGVGKSRPDPPKAETGACASQDAEGPGAASETAANAWNMPESPGFTRPHGSSVALNAAALSADELRRPSALK